MTEHPIHVGRHSPTKQPIKRWRHRHQILSWISVLAVPALLILTLANWRYRFEFEESGFVKFPDPAGELNGWSLENRERIRIMKDAGDPMLELQRVEGEKPVLATYQLPSMNGVKFVRVYAEMRCYGKHDGPGWLRARIHLLGYDKQNEPLYEYPHELGFLDGKGGWQIEDAVFQLAPEMQRLELQVLIKKTSHLQIKKLKVQVARERRGVLAYRPVSITLCLCWLFTLALVARAYGGTRKWWRACLVSAILISGFLTLVYPAIRRSVRPPLSKRFHTKSTFVFERQHAAIDTAESLDSHPRDSYEKRDALSYTWLDEGMAGIHIVLYSFFTLGVCLAAWSWKSFWLVGAVALLQEARQVWIDHSSDLGDLVDLCFDIIGVAIGVGAFLLIKLLESRFTNNQRKIFKAQSALRDHSE